MDTSDLYLVIFEQGQRKHARNAVLLLGATKLGPQDGSIKARLERVTDLQPLDRMMLRAPTAASWQEILDASCGHAIQDFAEGPVEEMKGWLLSAGEIRLGPADLLTRICLDNITDLERLERMFPRLWWAASWGELVNTA
jgi:hypothetical protein